MPISNNAHKHVRILLLVFILFNILFLASMDLLPFIDLPNHLAEAAIFKYFKPGNLLSQYYAPAPGYFPNTFHTVFCSLFPSVEWGNKMFHILYLVALQVSMYLVIKHLNGNPWYGLLALLFTYNYNITFGFVGFAISIPTLIICFYVILLYVETGKTYLSVIASFILVLLFFMHAQNALLGLVLFGLMLLYHHRKSFKKLMIHGILVPLPLIILILTWWFTRDAEQVEENTFDYLKEYYRSSYFQDFGMRFRIVVFDNFQLRDGIPGLAIAGMFFLAVLIPVFVTRPWRKAPLQSFAAGNTVYACIFFSITFLCYLFAPDKLPGQTPIFQRFCTIVMLSFIILASVLLKDQRAAWLRYFVISVVVIYTVLWTEYIHTFNRQNRNFDKSFFAETDSGKTLAGLIYENEFRGRKVYIHFPNYYLVWKRGIAASKIIDYRFGVVRRVASEEALPVYEELIGENYSYQPQYKSVDYLLVRGDPPVTKDVNLQNFSLKKTSGSWKIYQNKTK